MLSFPVSRPDPRKVGSTGPFRARVEAAARLAPPPRAWWPASCLPRGVRDVVAEVVALSSARRSTTSVHAEVLHRLHRTPLRPPSPSTVHRWRLAWEAFHAGRADATPLIRPAPPALRPELRMLLDDLVELATALANGR